jgi:hypothetical protein
LNPLLQLVTRYGSLALPLRLLLGAAVTLLAGAGIGFFAEYAAYRWALYYGIRPPLEGIPYLRVAVTALTVGILVGGALIFALAHAACLYVLRQIDSYISQFQAIESVLLRFFPLTNGKAPLAVISCWYKSLRFHWALLISVLVAFTVFVIPLIFFRSTATSESDQNGIIALAIFCFLLLLLAWRAEARLWISLAVLLSFVVISPFTLFSVDIYTNLLQIFGYGGGLPITVALVEEKTEVSQKTLISGSLMLRTNSSLILFQQHPHRIREIPLNQIIFIDHEVGPVSKRKIILPPI